MTRLLPSHFFKLGRFRRCCHRPESSLWAVEAEGTTSTCSIQEQLLKSTAKKTSPPPLFPWRHGTELPPRLVERKEEHESKLLTYETSTAFISTVTSGFYFHVPFLKLLAGQWKNELAESCSWAFVQGLAGILSNTYQISQEDIATYKEEDGISLDFKYNNEEKASTEKEESDGSSSNRVDDNLLLETKLCNLFRDAHKSGKDQIQVCLESTPTSAELHSLHSLPALSRKLAPNLLQEVQEDRSNGSQRMGNRYVDMIMKETGKVETTILAEVLVHCNERFWVKDLETGAIVQGYEDGKIRPVVHVIRLERVYTFVPGQQKSMGDWLITDIDDLLDGNRWFTPTVKNWWQTG